MSLVAKVKFVDYEKSACDALDLIQVAKALPQSGATTTKPNLTNSNPCRHLSAVGSKPPAHNPKESEQPQLVNGLLGELDNIETIEV